MRNIWSICIVATTVLLLSSCGGVGIEDVTTPKQKKQLDSYTLTNIPPSDILEGETYSYTPKFSPSLEQNAVFTISNPPQWILFDPDTGTISGTPAQTDIGTDSNIVIETTIGNTTLTTTPFSITVEEINLPPQISGTPENTTLYATRTYTFTPASYDPEGSALDFSISNIPDWVSFDKNTGKISAQPTIDDIGSEYEITISASDGKHQTSLEPFILSVKPGIETALVSWTPPTENTDGTVLEDLAGYRIYYGREAGKYDDVITLNSTELTTYTITNLLLPEYFFSMTAFDIYDNESEFSEVVSKRID